MTLDPKRFKVCESVTGMWFYHLRPVNDTGTTALCGARVMSCSLPLTAWGSKSEHISVKYCKKCEEIAANPEPKGSDA